MAKEEARRLLLITGDRGDVRSVDRALSGSPWEVDVVRDGESAVRALAQRSFDAGLLGLPLEPQGLALLRTLRPQMDGIPILLLTDTEDPGLADCVSLETWPETIPRSLLRTDLLARTLSHVVLRREIAKKLSQQEDLLRVSERIARMGGWEYDVATGANSWTSGLYELYGVARDYPISDVSAITRNFVDGGQERAVAAFRRALSMGKGFDFEEPFVEARGKQLWVRLTAEPVLEAGRVVKLRGNMIDVTAAHEAAEAGERERRSLRALLDQIPHFVSLLTSDGSVRFANRRFFELFGDAEGRKCYEVLLGRSSICPVCRTLKVLETGVPEEIIDRVFDPFFTTKSRDEGTGLGLSISYGIIRDHSGQFWIENRPGGGTRAHTDLPLRGSDDEEREEMKDVT